MHDHHVVAGLLLSLGGIAGSWLVPLLRLGVALLLWGVALLWLLGIRGIARGPRLLLVRHCNHRTWVGKER